MVSLSLGPVSHSDLVAPVSGHLKGVNLFRYPLAVREMSQLDPLSRDWHSELFDKGLVDWNGLLESGRPDERESHRCMRRK